MRRRFLQVDVFTDRPFAGNPVAVIFDADALSSERMQEIARWTNLSETTFVLKPTMAEASYRLRIFTPACEMPFAGHPTLGSCLAWRAVTGASTATRFVQECDVGLVPISVEADGALALRVPNRGLTDVSAEVRAVLEAALQAPAIKVPAVVDVGPRWLIMELDGAERVRRLTPDMAALTQLCNAQQITGVTVFGVDPAGGIETRSFAPHEGVPEDPVCGSGNGAVAYFRSRHEPVAGYVARQGRNVGRDGFVRVTFRPDGVWIAGHAVVCVDGTIDS